MLPSLPDGYRAIVVGATGGIGAAFVAALAADPRASRIVACSRRSPIPVDFDDEPGIARAAATLAEDGPYHLILNAAGLLHDLHIAPEKRIADIDARAMTTAFRVNAVGPALLLKHFAPLLARDRSLIVSLSAKVGSIGDNRMGGWISYRASKAALNMIVKTAAIELARTRPGAIVVALHPGTVATSLSRPFGGDTRGQPPTLAVERMLAALDGLTPADSGAFVAYDGTRLPW